MNHRDIESLDESTRELLLAEKTPPGAPASARARVFSRLEASASAPNAGGTRTSHPRSSGARGIAERGALGKAGPLAVAFVAGAAAGVAGDRWLASSTPPTAPYLQTSASAAEPISAALPDPAPSSAAPVSTAPAKAPPSASAPAESDLGAERALLDRARAVFAAGDPAATLAAVNAHAKRFPNGRLEEEREALAVKALVGAGRYDEARTRAARFRTRFPGSFLSSTVDEAIGTIP